MIFTPIQKENCNNPIQYPMPSKKGYQILSFRDKNGELYKVNSLGEYCVYHNKSLLSFSIDEMFDYVDYFLEIHSVKRMADGVIFELNKIPHYIGKVTHIDINLSNHLICILIESPEKTCCVFIEK